MPTRLSNLMILLLCVARSGYAQQPTNVTTNFTWVTPLPDEPLSVAADGPRGAYVLTKGNTLVQVDGQGRERWKQTLITWPTIRRIATGREGQLVVAGEFTGQFTIGDSTYRLGDTRQTSVFIAGFDSTHTRRWVTYVLTPGGLMSQLSSLAIGPDGDVLVFGRQANVNVPLLCQLDTDGRFVEASLHGAPVIPPAEAVTVLADQKGEARLSIAERIRPGTFSLLLATASETTPRWQRYVHEAFGAMASRRYDTTPLDIALDSQDNLFSLNNYTLVDRQSTLIVESGQALLRYDADGKNQWVKTGVSRPDSALATGLLADPAGAVVVHGGYNGPFDPPTSQFGPADYLSIAGYSPEGNPRWSTRLNAPTGNDRLIDLVRAENGGLMLAGRTTGTLQLGSLTAIGTLASPAHYLAMLQPFVLRPTSATVLCAGGNTTLRGTYAGHFEKAPVLQLSAPDGQFSALQTLATIPIGTAGNLLNVSDFAVSVPLSATAPPAATYRIRAFSSLPEYVGEPVSVTVATAPDTPTVSQVGDELVASAGAAGVSYQWFTNNREAVAGATAARFKPTGGGAYFVVATAGGCSAIPSEALNFLVTATEPTQAEAVIYPNPATDQFQVRWDTNGTTGTLLLTDLAGRQVRTQSQTGNLTTFSVTDLPVGLYLLTLRAEGQATQVRKVIVK